jgi:phage replication O-like protein O
MANPQKENGHFGIANELAEAFAFLQISGNQWRLLWVIIRQTYGWNKKADEISITQFQKRTRLQRRHICRSLKGLVERKIVTKNDTTKAATYGLQKDYSQWELSPKKTVPNNGDDAISKNGDSAITKNDTHKIQYKDNIKTGGQDVENSPPLDDNFHFKKKVSLPPGFYLTDRMKIKAKEYGCYEPKHVEMQFEKFCNHAAANGLKRCNWTRAFYNWLLEDKRKYNPEKYKVKRYEDWDLPSERSLNEH